MNAAPVMAGVDACKAGWVVATDAAGMVHIETFPSFRGLADALPPDALIVVDIPIGLPDHCHGGRGPEKAVRPLLGKRRSSAFEVPSRSAVYCPGDPSGDYSTGYRLATAIARATSTPPRAFARQGYGLFPKIREVDGYLREDPARPSRILESHPELAFRRLKGGPLDFPKKDARGVAERAGLLRAAGLADELLTGALPRRTGRDDVLDACAMLTVARRLAAGIIERYPAEPQSDRHGLPIAIHV